MKTSWLTVCQVVVFLAVLGTVIGVGRTADGLLTETRNDIYGTPPNYTGPCPNVIIHDYKALAASRILSQYLGNSSFNTEFFQNNVQSELLLATSYLSLCTDEETIGIHMLISSNIILDASVEHTLPQKQGLHTVIVARNEIDHLTTFRKQHRTEMDLLDARIDRYQYRVANPK